MELLTVLIVFFLGAVGYLIYRKTTESMNFWKKRGIVHKKGYPIVGNFHEFLLQRKNIAYIIQDSYNLFPKKRYYGVFQFTTPALYIRDLDLIKRITVRDFDHFTDHMSTSDIDLEPIFAKNLFILRGQQWKDMRNTLSHSFTGTKIRIMFNLIADCAKQFNQHFLKMPGETIEVEMKDLMTRLTTDVIATCAFGVECNSVRDDSEFRKMGMAIVKPSVRMWIKAFVQMLIPSLARVLKMSLLPAKVTNFFDTAIKDTLREREERNIVRQDMIHILMEAKKNAAEGDKTKITTEDIIAQGFLFFLAGFETVATLLSHVCNELAVNIDVQERLAQEVSEAFRDSEDVSYETISGMKYLDMVVSETLRKWPPAASTNRECTKDYKIEADQSSEEEDFVVPKGTGLIIPIFAIHRDPEYFPHPEKFDPERFSDENKHKLVPYSFMPFGTGPRNCIGLRFAILETKVIIAYLLSKFAITVTEKTQIPLVLSPKLPQLCPEAFWLGLKKRI